MSGHAYQRYAWQLRSQMRMGEGRWTWMWTRAGQREQANMNEGRRGSNTQQPPPSFLYLTNVYISKLISNILNSTKKTRGTPSTAGLNEAANEWGGEGGAHVHHPPSHYLVECTAMSIDMCAAFTRLQGEWGSTNALWHHACNPLI